MSSDIRDSDYKDKTVSRPSYLYNRNIHTWKLFLYWNRALLVWMLAWCWIPLGFFSKKTRPQSTSQKLSNICNSIEICFCTSCIPQDDLHQSLGLFQYPVRHHKILWSLEPMTLYVWIVSLLNLTGISAAVLPRCLSKFRVIAKF